MRGSHSKVLQILSKWQCRVSKCSQNAHKVLTEVPFPKSCKYHKHIRFRLQLAARAVEKEGFEVPLVMPYIYIYIFFIFLIPHPGRRPWQLLKEGFRFRWSFRKKNCESWGFNRKWHKRRQTHVAMEGILWNGTSSTNGWSNWFPMFD